MRDPMRNPRYGISNPVIKKTLPVTDVICCDKMDGVITANHNFVDQSLKKNTLEIDEDYIDINQKSLRKQYAYQYETLKKNNLPLYINLKDMAREIDLEGEESEASSSGEFEDEDSMLASSDDEDDEDEGEEEEEEEVEDEGKVPESPPPPPSPAKRKIQPEENQPSPKKARTQQPVQNKPTAGASQYQDEFRFTKRFIQQRNISDLLPEQVPLVFGMMLSSMIRDKLNSRPQYSMLLDKHKNQTIGFYYYMNSVFKKTSVDAIKGKVGKEIIELLQSHISSKVTTELKNDGSLCCVTIVVAEGDKEEIIKKSCKGKDAPFVHCMTLCRNIFYELENLLKKLIDEYKEINNSKQKKNKKYTPEEWAKQKIMDSSTERKPLWAMYRNTYSEIRNHIKL